MSNSELYTNYIRPTLAEFIAQLFFVFLHSSVGHAISNPANPSLFGNALVAATSNGLTVATLILVFGSISGCHINFVVTLAFALGGKMKLVLVPNYIVAQLLGSLSGAALALVTNQGAFGRFNLAEGVSHERGFLMEVILTAFLILVILLAAVEFNSNLAAIAVGFTVIVNIVAGFHISGGCMNPTLSFGPAVVSGQWANYWVYWAGPTLGSLVAVVLFRFFLSEKSGIFFKENEDLSEALQSVSEKEKNDSVFSRDDRL